MKSKSVVAWTGDKGWKRDHDEAQETFGVDGIILYLYWVVCFTLYNHQRRLAKLYNLIRHILLYINYTILNVT